MTARERALGIVVRLEATGVPGAQEAKAGMVRAIARAITAAVEEEREACAKIVEETQPEKEERWDGEVETYGPDWATHPRLAAAAIRARKEQPE